VVASEIHYPATIVELLELMRKNPGLLIYAGGTEILGERGGRFLELPPVVALIDGIHELKQVNLTERWVDIGAALTFSELLELKERALPDLFVQIIRGIGTPAIRNLATLGGNLATRRRFMDTWPVLACLEALVELRDAAGSRWVNVNRLVDGEGRTSFPTGSLLVRVRIPLDTWNITALRKVGTQTWPAGSSAIFSLAARADKGILAAFRIAFGGDVALRFPDLEARIVGRRLPLDPRERRGLSMEYREAAGLVAPGKVRAFGNLVDAALELFGK
jgi:xanthine dehydrogenase FAD-binding subunit